MTDYMINIIGSFDLLQLMKINQIFRLTCGNLRPKLNCFVSLVTNGMINLIRSFDLLQLVEIIKLFRLTCANLHKNSDWFHCTYTTSPADARGFCFPMCNHREQRISLFAASFKKATWIVSFDLLQHITWQ